MSRIGKQPVVVPAGVTVALSEGNVLEVKGRSPIEGGDGNVEFLARFTKDMNTQPIEILLGRVNYK